jgi:hypothetical protein
MKKWMIAAGFVVALSACNDGLRSDENNSDSTEVLVDNPAPASDTANRVNNMEAYPGDTGNQNADDSIKGTHPASRKTTPRNPGSGNNQ